MVVRVLTVSSDRGKRNYRWTTDRRDTESTASGTVVLALSRKGKITKVAVSLRQDQPVTLGLLDLPLVEGGEIRLGHNP